MINAEGQVKMVDFGIAKEFGTGTEDSQLKEKFFTQISSPLYAAPEIKSSS